MENLASSRREWLQRASGGFAATALGGLLARADSGNRIIHHPARADQVIFIFSTGGVSHVDTFDPKAKLTADHGKSITASRWLNKPGNFQRFLVKSRFGFKNYGRSGLPFSELFPHLGSMADELCVLRGMHCDSDGHDKATLAAHTGSAQFARPSAGAWVSYGLGTLNENLPGFMVLAPAAPYAGAQTWSSDFLPGSHQGTHVIPGPNPLPHVKSRSPREEMQRLELDFLAGMNRGQLRQTGPDRALEARIRSFETAFGMQREAPEALDITRETDQTLAMYGVDRKATSGFGWQCLAARRLLERGVRFIELIDVGSSGNWDSHGNMADHIRLAKAIDQPIAALIADLRRRGMLERTLVVWTTEFGRTSFNATADHPGREHHNLGFTSWMAGGGVRGGMAYGGTDEYGIQAVEGKVHTHDLHATILHLLGIDHEKLTFRHAGRDYRLTDIAGEVVQGILA
ncbi:MAG: DUF1501 domain-containing protein [Planctomycetota bacterium]|jgi:hypothetical protein|nr:DUF1501 domain-containing protein [Planctomycetota bacterium]